MIINSKNNSTKKSYFQFSPSFYLKTIRGKLFSGTPGMFIEVLQYDEYTQHPFYTKCMCILSGIYKGVIVTH